MKAVEKHFVTSPEHNYCQLHHQHFRTYAKYREHVESFHENHCKKCDYRIFATRHDYEQHLEKSLDHYWCRECDREFSSEHNYQEVRLSSSHSARFQLRKLKHMTASKRHAVADVVCPFCDDVFISQSARMIHIEKQWCTSGPSPEAILDAAQRVDPNGILAPSPRCTEEDSYHCALTDISPRNGPKVASCGRIFSSFGSLLQHIDLSSSCTALRTARVRNMASKIEAEVLKQSDLPCFRTGYAVII